MNQSEFDKTYLKKIIAQQPNEFIQTKKEKELSVGLNLIDKIFMHTNIC